MNSLRCLLVLRSTESKYRSCHSSDAASMRVRLVSTRQVAFKYLSITALRLYPTLPMNIRFADKPTVLPRGGGPDGKYPTLLAKGAGIVYSVYHLHRREEIYGSDSKFYRPQRWESGDLIKKARTATGYVDFNAGPRICLGSTLPIFAYNTCNPLSVLQITDQAQSH